MDWISLARRWPRPLVIGDSAPPAPSVTAGPRPLAQPLHVADPRGLVRLDDGHLVVERDGLVVSRRRLHEVSQLCLHGEASATSPLLRELMTRGIPVLWRGRSGWLCGMSADLSGHVSRTRRAQYAACADENRCLAIGRAIIEAKLAATRTLLRRRLDPASRTAFRELKAAAPATASAPSLAVLRGVEGSIAAVHFGLWPRLLRTTDPAMAFNGRSRQPPRDPPNALLSYFYAVLVGECAAAVLAAGLDPAVGFLHAERPGRPALALDLLEPFRISVADSAALFALNAGEIDRSAFEPAEDGIRLTLDGRRRALVVLERRLGEPVTPAGGGEAVDWRRIIHLDAANLARALRENGPVSFHQPR